MQFSPLCQPIRFQNKYCVYERANEQLPNEFNLQDRKALGHFKRRNYVLVSPPRGVKIYWPEIVNQNSWKRALHFMTSDLFIAINFLMFVLQIFVHFYLNCQEFS